MFTFSIHQANLYSAKEQSDLDIGLADGAGDDEYLEKLENGLDTVFNGFRPQFVLYFGGVDPYQKDLPGSLRLSTEGIRNRDTIVFQTCRDQGCPVTAVLAGGYAADLRDTLDMHINTYFAMRKVFA